MEYDVKKNLINELSKQLSGTGIETEKSGQITAKFDPSTGSLSFDLSGTNYNVKDLSEAKKFFAENAKSSSNPDHKKYYEIGAVCIDSIIREFTDPKTGA